MEYIFVTYHKGKSKS